MAKADKSTVVRRTQEVLRLLLAGGEFEDIRQYASAQGWQLSNRQLRRYQERAYAKLASAAHRDQRQLLGRHLMQRRALYARALKTSDVRTALQVLRDEADLEGLYPSARGGVPVGGNQSATSPLSREQRFLRILAAESRGDREDLRLMEHITPHWSYCMPDTAFPRLMLNLISLIYTAEQLDHASMVLMALWHLGIGGGGDDWELIGNGHAYRFKVGADGWEEFTTGINVDGHALVANNHQGTALKLFSDRIYELAPSEEALAAQLTAAGQPPLGMLTAGDLALQWRQLLGQVVRE